MLLAAHTIAAPSSQTEGGEATREWSTRPGKHATAVEQNFKNQWKEIIEQHLGSPAIVCKTDGTICKVFKK